MEKKKTSKIWILFVIVLIVMVGIYIYKSVTSSPQQAVPDDEVAEVPKEDAASEEAEEEEEEPSAENKAAIDALLENLPDAEEEHKRIQSKGDEEGPDEFAYTDTKDSYHPSEDPSFVYNNGEPYTEKMEWRGGYLKLQDDLGLEDPLMDEYIVCGLYERAQLNSRLEGEELSFYLLTLPALDFDTGIASFAVKVQTTRDDMTYYLYHVTANTTKTDMVIKKMSLEEYSKTSELDIYYYTEYEELFELQGIQVANNAYNDVDEMPVLNAVLDEEGNSLTPGTHISEESGLVIMDVATYGDGGP